MSYKSYEVQQEKSLEGISEKNPDYVLLCSVIGFVLKTPHFFAIMRQ